MARNDYVLPSNQHQFRIGSVYIKYIRIDIGCRTNRKSYTHIAIKCYIKLYFKITNTAIIYE